MAWGYARTSRVETPTSAAPFPRAIPCPAAIATRSPVNDPGPVATATRVTAERALRVFARIRSIAGNSSSPCRRWACHVSSASTSRPSKSATDAQVVEVSSANNTRADLLDQSCRAGTGRREDDAPLRVRDVLETDLEPIAGEGVRRAIRPFDDRDAARVDCFLPAGVRDVDALEAIQVDVEEREPPAAVLAHDDERRAGDVGRVDPEAARDAAREHGLPGTELAGQSEHVIGRRERAQALAEALGVQ